MPASPHLHEITCGREPLVHLNESGRLQPITLPREDARHGRHPSLPTGRRVSADDIKAMSMALDDVCKELKLDGNANAKETIAVRIIELARCGERSPTKLEFCAKRTIPSASAT
jgi:hypothetical protein